jgi:ABC-type Na+ efflux pump permease subunit
MNRLGVYIGGGEISLSVFSLLYGLFLVSGTEEAANALSNKGNLLDIILAFGIFLLSVAFAAAYLLIGVLFLKRDSAKTLSSRDKFIGVMALIALLASNFFVVNALFGQLSSHDRLSLL